MLLQNHLFADTVKGWFFMLAKDILEEGKLEYALPSVTLSTFYILTLFATFAAYSVRLLTI